MDNLSLANPNTIEVTEPLTGKAVSFDKIPKQLLKKLYFTWRNNTALPVVAKKDWSRSLRAVRIIGLFLLFIQLIILCWWSDILVSRGATTLDFAIFYQPVYLIAHGNLDPYLTVHSYYFYNDHAAFIMWPLTIFYLIWPHGVTLSFIQDAAAVGAEVIGFLWICDIAASKSVKIKSGFIIPLLVLITALILCLNPWTIWACSFDFHVEALTTFFVLGTARALYRDKKTMWIWLALALACGDLATVYLLALGLSAVITGKHWLKRGLALCLIALVYEVFLNLIHGTRGDGLQFYSNLTGVYNNKISPTLVIKSILAHPSRVTKTLTHNRLDIYADISPEGFLGYLWPPTAIVSLLTLTESALNGQFTFVQPGFQNIALVSFVGFGTGAVLLYIATKGKKMRLSACICGLLLAANACGWAYTWLPQVSNNWLLISPQQSQVLDHIQTMIKPQDEVIASNGFVGKFANRKYIYDALQLGTLPMYTKAVWFVIAPDVGIETMPVNQSNSMLNQISLLPGAKLVLSEDGIWVYKWRPPKGINNVNFLAGNKKNISATFNYGQAGTPITDGPVKDWYVASTGQPGYVIAKSYWQVGPGNYSAKVELSDTITADVEIWDNNNSELLARRITAGTGGQRLTLTIPIDIKNLTKEAQFTGWGPWQIGYSEPPTDTLEIRVWSPGGNNQVSVYKVAIVKTR